jgi:hypothetical protein
MNLNPYSFQMSPNSTLHIEAALTGHRIEMGTILVDRTNAAQKDFPCLPLNKQPPGFIWGIDTCDPFSVPPCASTMVFDYTAPNDGVLHEMLLNGIFKPFACGDGEMFVNPWAGCPISFVQPQPWNLIFKFLARYPASQTGGGYYGDINPEQFL